MLCEDNGLPHTLDPCVCVFNWKPADSLRRGVSAMAADIWPEVMGCPEAVGQGEEMLLVTYGDEGSSWQPFPHAHVGLFFLIFFFNIYLFLRQRETEHEQGRGRERGRHRI